MKCISCNPAARCFLLLVGLSTLSASSNGQNYIDLIRISYGRSGSARFQGTNDKTTIVDFGVDTNIPVSVNNHVTILTGIMYELMKTKLYRDTEESTMQSAGVKLGATFTSTEHRWMGTCLLLPRVSTDLHHLNRQSLQMGGLIVFRKTINPFANFKLGLYMNSEFFGTWIVPMVGFYYQRTGNAWEVSVFLPVSFDVSYALPGRVRAGVIFTGMRRSYQLSAIPTYGGVGYLDRIANDLGGYLSWSLTKGIVVQSKVTYSIGRESKVFEKGDKIDVGFPLVSFGDNRVQLNDNVMDGWQAQLLLIYRLKFDRTN